MKRDSWFRINKDGGNEPGAHADNVHKARQSEARSRALKVGTFEEEDFLRSFKHCDGRVERLGVRWESQQHIYDSSYCSHANRSLKRGD